LPALGGGVAGPVAAQAFELSLDPPTGGLVIGVSHEGGTPPTTAARQTARAAGARTALLTVSDRSPGAAIAEVVVETGELDLDWCHTIGYVSPLIAASVVGARLARSSGSGAALRARLADGIAAAMRTAPEIASRLGDAARLLVIASGA